LTTGKPFLHRRCWPFRWHLNRRAAGGILRNRGNWMGHNLAYISFGVLLHIISAMTLQSVVVVVRLAKRFTPGWWAVKMSWFFR
jgi:hypothetical protein